MKGAPGLTMVFQNANYFLNFQKFLGISKGVKVDNETSQQQIIKMYKLGHEIPWDMRKAQPAIQQVLIDTGTERARGCWLFFDVYARGRLTLYLLAVGARRVLHRSHPRRGLWFW